MLRAAGAARVFADSGISGSTIERPQLSKALDRLEAGDVLTVWKLDRLGRNTRHVLDIIENIREQGAGFRSLIEGLDTSATR
ncbi:recombinase family protein [Pseudarthrobacter albicanus]|uniref:recombinase family protein n=1 Tax=Pseudarthrobacter albicanus TaxID=2823873 RepID=UPI001FE91A73|nr:recombinase family protein [Pseudarthrobacter albicanus]